MFQLFGHASMWPLLALTIHLLHFEAIHAVTAIQHGNGSAWQAPIANSTTSDRNLSIRQKDVEVHVHWWRRGRPSISGREASNAAVHMHNALKLRHRAIALVQKPPGVYRHGIKVVPIGYSQESLWHSPRKFGAALVAFAQETLRDAVAPESQGKTQQLYHWLASGPEPRLPEGKQPSKPLNMTNVTGENASRAPQIGKVGQEQLWRKGTFLGLPKLLWALVATIIAFGLFVLAIPWVLFCAKRRRAAIPAHAPYQAPYIS